MWGRRSGIGVVVDCRGRRRSAVTFPVHRRARIARRPSRVRDPPVAVPAEGGRRAHVGNSPVFGPLALGSDRDPDGRVRQRCAGPGSCGTVRGHHGRARPVYDVRGLRRPRWRANVVHGEPPDLVRIASTPATRAARSPRGVRDDLGGADGPVRLGVRSSQAVGAGATSITRRNSSGGISPNRPYSAIPATCAHVSMPPNWSTA